MPDMGGMGMGGMMRSCCAKTDEKTLGSGVFFRFFDVVPEGRLREDRR